MIAPWLRDRRRQLRLSQTALANQIGVTQAQVSGWETSKHLPTPAQFAALVRVLGPDGAPTRDLLIAPQPGKLRSDLPLESLLAPNVFVRAEDGHGRGTGKITEIRNGSALVTYFHSLTALEAVSHPVSTLRVVRLQPQTRCFFQDANKGWVVGRIGSSTHEGDYEVLLPDRRAVFVKAAQLAVRSAALVEDPVEVLILGAQESPFLHDRRYAFLQSLVEQRAVAHGMTGLLSSRIELYPHQIEVVRRVLEDPIQRYLLADEVGLGKTIEAGIILRQYLLDSQRPRALVIVPPMLVEQWRRELDQKFVAFASPGAVTLLAADALDALEEDIDFSLLIVDEAHHAAELAFSDDVAARRRFEIYRRLARVASRVLLLTATPVLRHERDFLAMLHLLDPERYALSDLDTFKRRVEKRETVGRMLRALREDLSNTALIKLNLSTLRREFNEDGRLAALADEVDRVIGAHENAETRRRAIRAVRVHIGETYRLHRRMLRTRRLSVESESGTVIAPRFDAGAKKSGLIEEYDLDERADAVHDLLETWRSSAASSLVSLDPGIDGRFERSAALHQVFLLLFQAAGSWLDLFGYVVRARRDQVPNDVVDREFDAAEVRTICTAPLFDGERKILNDLIEVLERPHTNSRIDLVVEMTRSLTRSTVGSNRPVKIAIFTRFSVVCQELTARLTSAFGRTSVACHQKGRSVAEVEFEVNRFASPGSDCQFLVADRSGEEGRNFQAADVIVHFDLPWSPNQLEQRIGRLDRIGRARAVRARVCLGPDTEGSIFEAWFRVLRDGFGVFYSSIAALQFFVDSRLPELEREFLAGGAAALDEAVGRLREEVAQEHARLEDHDALDQIDLPTGDRIAYSQSLSDLDAHHDRIAQGMDGWVAEALLFSRKKDVATGTVKYTPTRQSLVAADVLLDRFEPFLRGYLGTFEREVSTMYPDVALFRIGDPFVDSLMKYLRSDDRGQAFAVWRQVPSWPAHQGAEWLGFRFNYLIETDASVAESIVLERLKGADLAALRRRADAWFRPLTQTIFLDVDGREPRNAAILRVLAAPYVPVKHGGHDTNLAKEKAAVIGTCVDFDRWPTLCRKACETSRSLLVGGDALRAATQSSVERAELDLKSRIEQLQLRTHDERSSHVPNAAWLSDHDADIERGIGEALIAGIRAPQVRLDSLGFIILSSRTPHSGVVRDDAQ
jgi:ATP-dependent helicase HepA